jgi:hypothetical protein
MQAIEFETYSKDGVIKIPESYQDWYGNNVKVILLRQEPSATKTDSKGSRPIGLAQDKFQVSPLFFDELPEELLAAFEGQSE